MIELQLSLLSELERITLWKKKKQHLGCRQQDGVGDHPLVSNQVGGEEPRSAKEEFMMMVITMMERHNMKMDCQKMTMMANCRWLWWRRCWWWGGCWWISDGDRRARLTWRPEKRMEEEEWARMFSGKLTLSDWFLSHRKNGFVYFWNSISHI